MELVPGQLVAVGGTILGKIDEHNSGHSQRELPFEKNYISSVTCTLQGGSWNLQSSSKAASVKLHKIKKRIYLKLFLEKKKKRKRKKEKRKKGIK